MRDTNTEFAATDKNSSGCSCCDTGGDGASPVGGGDVQLQVWGMTCGHCVSSVIEELEELDGVRQVSVDLVPNGTSTVTVDAASDLDSAALQRAIADAGYELVTS